MDYIIVGLGNPGREYEKTRHNAGRMALDKIASKYNVKINKLKFKALYAQTEIKGKKVLLLKPETFMNASGISVAEAADFYKIPAEHIVVLCDDISLPNAKLRIRREGSAGGHNGLKSIINMLETQAFPRVRIGVADRPDRREDLANWVCGNFTAEEMTEIENVLNDVCESCEMIVAGDIDGAMAKFNQREKHG